MSYLPDLPDSIGQIPLVSAIPIKRSEMSSKYIRQLKFKNQLIVQLQIQLEYLLI